MPDIPALHCRQLVGRPSGVLKRIGTAAAHWRSVMLVNVDKRWYGHFQTAFPSQFRIGLGMVGGGYIDVDGGGWVSGVWHFGRAFYLFSHTFLPGKLVTTIFNPQAADTSRTQTEMDPCGLTLLNDTFICHCNAIQQLIPRISRRKISRETHTSSRIP
jgi:hypothetical protein